MTERAPHALTMLLSWPPILYAPAFALLFFWVCLALGDRMLKLLRLRVAELSLVEHGFVALGFGVGLVQFFPFCLGLFGMMTPGAIRAGAALLTVAMLPDMLRVARRVWTTAREQQKTPLARPTLAWAGLLAVLLLVVLFRALAVRSFGDDDGYHLSAPRRWLEQGRLAYLPTFTHTNAPAGYEMTYVIGLAVGGVVCAKILHYAAGLCALLGIWLASARAGAPLGGKLAIAAILTVTPLLDVPLLFGVAYVDLPMSWMITTTVLLWFVLQKNRSLPALVCLALFVGFAGSFKFTALSAGVAWELVLLLEARRRGLAWKDTLLLLAAFGALAALPVLPWLYKNFSLTGNPLYPMLSSVVPTRDWTPEHADVFGRYVRYYAWGVASGAKLSLQHRQVALAVGMLGVVGGTAFAYARIKDTALRGVLVVAGVFTVMAIGITGLIFRYWLPAALCLIIVVCVVAARWLGTKPWARWLPALLMAVACATTLRSTSNLPGSFRLALGISSADDEFASDPWWQVWRYLNTKQAPDGAVLAAAFYTTFGASSFGGYWVDRMVYATDSHLQTFIDFQSWPRFVSSVNRLGIRYVLIAEGQFAAGRHGFLFTAQQNEFPFCRRLTEEFGHKVFQAGFLQLYEVSPPASDTPGRAP